MHRPTEQSHEEHVEAGRRGGRARSKASGESDPVETDSPAKKQRSINKSGDYDPDFAKDDGLSNDGKNPNRVEAGKKAAETRKRNAAKNSQSQDDEGASKSQDDDSSSKQSSHGKMHRPTEQTHEEHVEAGKKGAEARWGKGSTDESSSDKSSNKKSNKKGQDAAKKLMDELSEDPKIQELKDKQNGERDAEIKECQQLIQQALKQSSKPDLSLMMKPQGKNLIQVIRAEHRLVEQLGEQLTAMLQDSDEINDIALGMSFNIMKLLSIHAACEEMVVYPMLKAKGHDALVEHALEEHTEMKRDLVMLNDLFGQADQVSEFMNKLQKCLEDTLHHVTEEEESLLPLIESLNSDAELEKLLVQFLEGHLLSPTRPHLDAAAEPPQNIETNPQIAKQDMQMDIDEGRFEIPVPPVQ